MLQEVFVKPATPETKVPRETGGYFAAEGERVAMTLFVRRRIRDGDLVVVDAAKPSKRKGGEA